MPQVLPMTRVEAYLAYKAGVIQESELKPTLKTNFYTGLEHWLAFWCGLCDDYPVDENNDPKWYNEEEYYIAYLCGIAQDYPTNCYRRVGAYLRHIISYRWPAPEKPLTREEYYLSLINSTTTSNPTPSSIFTLNDTTDGVLQGVEVYGDTFQQTYTGKNKFGAQQASTTLLDVTSTIADGIVTLDGTTSVSGNIVTDLQTVNFTAKANTEYTITCRLISGDITFNNHAIALYLREQDGTSIPGANVGLAGVISSGVQTNHFTVTTDTALALRVYANSAGIVIDDFVMSVQIEEGSSTAFEPYVGGIPAPNPDYPQDINVVTGAQTIKVVGKNLLNFESSNFENKYINIDGDRLSSGNSATSLSPIRVTPGEILVCSYNAIIAGTSLNYGHFYDNAGNYIGRTAQAIGKTPFQVPEGATQLFCTFYHNGGLPVADISDYLTDVQLEKGSTATEYQPYQSQSYPLSLGSLELCKIGGYQDYIWNDNGTWKKHKLFGKFTFDDTYADIIKSGASTVDYNIFAFDKLVQNGILIDYALRSDSLTNRFIWQSSTGQASLGSNVGYTLYNNLSGSCNDFAVSFKSADMPDVTALKTWLNSNPITLYAVLTTPTDETITDAALVAQLEALAAGQSYDPLTNFIVAATDPNLPALLKVTAYKKQ